MKYIIFQKEFYGNLYQNFLHLATLSPEQRGRDKEGLWKMGDKPVRGVGDYTVGETTP